MVLKLIIDAALSPFKRFIGFAQRLRKSERRNLVLLLGLGLVGVNALYAVNPGHAFAGRAGALAIGAVMAVLALAFLLVIVAEYKRRFTPRPKGLVDVICLDCDLVGGKTALCPGCPYNPFSKQKQKEFDLLETV